MWNRLIAIFLALLLVSGVVLSWQFLRFGSLAEMGWMLLALLAGASIVPALGLLVWWRSDAKGSVSASLFLIVAALAGAASSAVGWLTILASLAV
jgi:hypothetical protein